ncbi:MAG: cysteine hydrolase [Sedimentisphaerales bacterium]|nr:cysteine hydrolase [Sedimentisphaerales bacterium]
MILQLVRTRRKQVLIDVDTQRDFLVADGKTCIRNHRRVLGHIRRVMAWARVRGIPIISLAEVHPNNNGDSEYTYCIDGTNGQKKVRYTLVSNRISFPADGHTDLPRDLLRQYNQVILHKRCSDPFEEPRIERLLSELRANEFIVIGSAAEGAVKATTLGLLQRGKKVTLVTDAVGSHNKREAKLALRKVEAKGAKLVETKRIAGISHLRHIGACHCESCKGLTRKAPANLKEVI